ncbi:MAG: iron ABC transporter permease [Treponema sp.]|jgi:iron complex transport system permease protein|nr:iron ABC transporter permease [Treponema sp.]
MIYQGRTGAAFLVLFTSFALLAGFSLCRGSVDIPLPRVFSILGGREKGVGAEIVLNIRLPRILMAAFTGMMLSIAGTVSQAVFRNPLADPYIVGISAGASAGAAAAFLLGLPDLYFGVSAFVTALGTAFLIFRLSALRGGTDTGTLLIIGIAVSAFLSAFTSLGMYFAGQDSYRVMLWTMGYLGGASWRKVIILSAPLITASAWFLYRRHDIDALLLSDEEAHSLGVNVGTLKRRLLMMVSFITAFSVAFAGMIGFVGLIVPHIIRLCTGSSHSRLLPLAGLAGGVFLLFADTLARSLLSPVEIPIGIVTAFFGAPFFIFLAIRSGRPL